MPSKHNGESGVLESDEADSPQGEASRPVASAQKQTPKRGKKNLGLYFFGLVPGNAGGALLVLDAQAADQPPPNRQPSRKIDNDCACE